MLMAIDRDRYLTLKEAQGRTGYAYDHLRKLIREGAVAAIEIDPRKHLIDWLDLQRYMKENPQRKPYKKGISRNVKPKRGRSAPITPGAVLRRAAAQASEASEDNSDVQYVDPEESA